MEDRFQKEVIELGEIPVHIPAYIKNRIFDFITSEVSQKEKEVAKEILTVLETQGHGSGNWRRLVIQLKAKYEI